MSDTPDFWNQNGDHEAFVSGRDWALATAKRQKADGANLCRISFEENGGRTVWLVEGWKESRAVQGTPSFAYTAGAP